MIISNVFCIFAESYMKYKGSRCDFTEERDAELLRAYKHLLSVRDNISLSEIAEVISQSPCKRFWVSVRRANEVICDLEKGKTLSKMIPTRREMFLEIYRRYKVYKVEHPSLTKMEILWHVCNENAPKFYLTPKSIIVILGRVRKEDAKRRCYELRKRRLRFMLGTL